MVCVLSHGYTLHPRLGLLQTAGSLVDWRVLLPRSRVAGEVEHEGTPRNINRAGRTGLGLSVHVKTPKRRTRHPSYGSLHRLTAVLTLLRVRLMAPQAEVSEESDGTAAKEELRFVWQGCGNAYGLFQTKYDSGD